MRISIPEATGILNQVMRKLGHAEEDLHPIVDHLMDCELRGLSYGGLARAVAITERIGRLGMPKEPTEIFPSMAGMARTTYDVAPNRSTSNPA